MMDVYIFLKNNFGKKLKKMFFMKMSNSTEQLRSLSILSPFALSI